MSWRIDASKSHQKASQKLTKSLPKSSQNPSQNPPSKLNALENRFFPIFSNFFQFFEGPGPPKIQAKSLKIPKKRYTNGAEKKKISKKS